MAGMDRQLTDTDPDAARVLVELLRRAAPGQRASLALSLSTSVRDLAYAGIRRRSPGISALEAGLEFVAIHYGRDLAESVRSHVSLRASR